MEDLSAQPEEQVVTDPSHEEVEEQVSPEELLDKSLEGAFGEEPELAPAETVQATQPQPWDNAPQHWPEAERARFVSLPDDQKQFVYKSVTDSNRAAQMKMDQAAGMRREVADFVQRQTQQPQPVERESAIDDIPPEDPIDRLKWETKREIRQEREQEQGQRLQSDKQAAIANLIRQTSQDPLEGETRFTMDRMIEQNFSPARNPGDPKGRTYQQIEFDELAADPLKFTHSYQAARGVVINSKKTQQRPVSHEPPSRTTRTPVLERAGITSPPAAVNDAVVKKKNIIRDIRKGRTSPGTLTDLLDASIDDSRFA